MLAARIEPPRCVGPHEQRAERRHVRVKTGRSADRDGSPRRRRWQSGARVDHMVCDAAIGRPAADCRRRRRDAAGRDGNRRPTTLEWRLMVVGDPNDPAGHWSLSSDRDVSTERDENAAAGCAGDDCGRPVGGERLRGGTQIELDTARNTQRFPARYPTECRARRRRAALFRAPSKPRASARARMSGRSRRRRAPSRAPESRGRRSRPPHRSQPPRTGQEAVRSRLCGLPSRSHERARCPDGSDCTLRRPTPTRIREAGVLLRARRHPRRRRSRSSRERGTRQMRSRSSGDRHGGDLRGSRCGCRRGLRGLPRRRAGSGHGDERRGGRRDRRKPPFHPDHTRHDPFRVGRRGGEHGEEPGQRQRERSHDDARLASSPSAGTTAVLRVSHTGLHGFTVPSADETLMKRLLGRC